MLFFPPLTADQPAVVDEAPCREFARKILVVEDFGEIRDSLAFLLRNQGYAVYQACDGLEGWRMIQRQAFDLVLTDILMPCLNGDVLVERIHLHFPQIPVIVMTAGEIDTGRILLESGKIIGVLYKPFETGELTAVLERLWPPPREAAAAAPNAPAALP